MASSSEREMDVENARRGVWLVKVPKYLSTEWEKVPAMTEIGRLKIGKDTTGRTDIVFNVSDEVVNRAKERQEKEAKSNHENGKKEATPAQIPQKHQFTVSDISHQHLAVFSHSKTDDKPKRPKLEGHVVQKGECRPSGADPKYMGLKRQSFVQSAQPKRVMQHIEKAVVTYKPISAHKADTEFEQKKKSEGKKARDDKDSVADKLFSAFEKHQYYALKDLAKITNQPIPYLKEILNEFCVYNNKNPHKNTWELKPEYRHYNSSSKSE